MNYEYDVAISFAGEDRNIAKEIAQKLSIESIKVFYDEYEEANLFGLDLYEHLHDVYGRKARFCIMLISQFYASKAWTQHERKSAQERALKESKPYILPVRLDDTTIPGIRDTVGYVDLRKKSIDELITIIKQKLGEDTSDYLPTHFTNAPKFSIPLPTIKKVFSERDRDKFNQESFQLIKKYFQQGIAEINKMDRLEGDYTDMGIHKFSCKIYANGRRTEGCTIWLGSFFGGSTSICYSSQAHQESNNSMNETLTIEDRNGVLTFKGILNIFHSEKSDNLSAQDAAEYLWNKFIMYVK